MKPAAPRLVPSYRIFQADGRTVSSFRWLSVSWDAVWVHGKSFFVQYGKKPSRFFFMGSDQIPTYLLSAAYRTVFCWKHIRAGIAIKPKNFDLAWRQHGISTATRPRT